MFIEPDRRRTPKSTDDSKWYDDPFAVVGLAVVVFVACGFLYMLVQDYRARRDVEALASVIQQSTAAMSRLFRAPSPPVQPQTIREYVPSRDVPTCKKVTGGEINEQFARCRAGYWVTYPSR